MRIKKIAMMTGILFSLNGSLDAIIDYNYSMTKAAPNYYMIGYFMNKDKSDYKPYVYLDWKTFK